MKESFPIIYPFSEKKEISKIIPQFHDMSEFSGIRPDARQGQVLDASRIKPGVTYSLMHDDEEADRVVALTKPFFRNGKGLWINALSLDTNMSNFRQLAELGVVPYVDKSGQQYWSRSNWLKAPESENEALTVANREKQPGQVDDPKALVVGARFLLIGQNLTPVEMALEVIREPYRFGGRNVVGVKSVHGESDAEVRVDLAYLGIEPLWRVWNNSDYIVEERHATGYIISFDEMRDSIAEKRKTRPGQVHNPNYFSEDRKYQTRHGEQSDRDYSFKVIGDAYKDENGRWVMDILRDFGDGKETGTKLDLGDYGVVPHSEAWVNCYLVEG